MLKLVLPGLELRQGLLFLNVLLVASVARAQAAPTAARNVDLTVFAGVARNYTGLSGGQNGSVSAGLDLNLPPVFLVRPSLEVRGLSPFSKGKVDEEKDLLGGVRLGTSLGSVEPYVDLLGGRGEISFVQPYVTFAGTFLYRQPASTVISPGAGLRVRLSGNLSAFGDLQFSTGIPRPPFPVTSSPNR